MNWQVLEPKGKGNKVRTTMAKHIDIEEESDMVIGDVKMTIKNRVIDMFH